jgi:hypothetical protein
LLRFFAEIQPSKKIIQEKFGLLTLLSKFVLLIKATQKRRSNKVHGNSGEKRKTKAGDPEIDPGRVHEAVRGRGL